MQVDDDPFVQAPEKSGPSADAKAPAIADALTPQIEAIMDKQRLKIARLTKRLKLEKKQRERVESKYKRTRRYTGKKIRALSESEEKNAALLSTKDREIEDLENELEKARKYFQDVNEANAQHFARMQALSHR